MTPNLMYFTGSERPHLEANSLHAFQEMLSLMHLLGTKNFESPIFVYKSGWCSTTLTLLRPLGSGKWLSKQLMTAHH